LSIDSQIVHYSVRVKFSSRLNPSLAAYWLDRIGYSCLLHFPADRLFLRQPLARHTVIVFGRKIKERIRSKQGGNRTRTGRNRAAAFRNALWNRLQHWTTFITCRGTLSVASSGGHLPLHYYACNRDATLDVILYLVQEEYPESLQVTNSSGKRPIDLAKRPPTSRSCSLVGIRLGWWSCLRAPLIAAAVGTSCHRIDIDPPASSQQPSLSLHPVNASSFD
jgi:hypothetical protein